jgi:serine protease AprX
MLGVLTDDPAVETLSSDQAVRSHMSVTNASIGADLVHAGVAGAPGLTGAGVSVAILDSGISVVPELRGKVLASVDFTEEQANGQDKFGHGTHVAGIVAAHGNAADADSVGVAPGAMLINVRVLDSRGEGRASDVIAAIDWVIANRFKYNIRVINLSLGAPVMQSWRLDPLCQAVERAFRAGIVVVAAAGNQGKTADGKTLFGGIVSPGNSPYAITVGALNTKQTPWRSDDVLATYSSRGPTRFDHVIKPDLIAPGNRIKGLLPPDVVVRHKTGTLNIGVANDVGIVELPNGGGHLVLAIFVKESTRPAEQQERAIAQIARAAYDYFLFNPGARP